MVAAETGQIEVDSHFFCQIHKSSKLVQRMLVWSIRTVHELPELKVDAHDRCTKLLHFLEIFDDHRPFIVPVVLDEPSGAIVVVIEAPWDELPARFPENESRAVLAYLNEVKLGGTAFLLFLVSPLFLSVERKWKYQQQYGEELYDIGSHLILGSTCLGFTFWLPFHTLRFELAFIAHMEDDHAVEFVAIDNGPATTLSRVHLVIPVPRELYARLAISGRWPIVDLTTDISKTETTPYPWAQNSK